MPNSRARNIKHATSTHPHLERRHTANERMTPGDKWGKERHFDWCYGLLCKGYVKTIHHSVPNPLAFIEVAFFAYPMLQFDKKVLWYLESHFANTGYVQNENIKHLWCIYQWSSSNTTKILFCLLFKTYRDNISEEGHVCKTNHQKKKEFPKHLAYILYWTKSSTVKMLFVL